MVVKEARKKLKRHERFNRWKRYRRVGYYGLASLFIAAVVFEKPLATFYKQITATALSLDDFPIVPKDQAEQSICGFSNAYSTLNDLRAIPKGPNSRGGQWLIDEPIRNARISYFFALKAWPFRNDGQHSLKMTFNPPITNCQLQATYGSFLEKHRLGRPNSTYGILGLHINE